MEHSKLTVALLQMTSSLDVAENAHHVSQAIGEAAKQGADILSTPEMTNFLSRKKADAFERAVQPSDDLVLKAAIEGAKTHKLWVHLGSLCCALDGEKLVNRSFVINPSGVVVAHYDKIHMFDVDLGDNEVYRESALYQPGEHAVVVDIGPAKIGLNICYDLRFAALQRAQAQAGASILLMPAAFTQPTGEAHWETLLRARAIENGSFVLAAAQTGKHECGRSTHGHSIAFDPWGNILESLAREPGVLYIALDLGLIDQARGKIASLQHDRPFDVLKVRP